MNYNSRYEAIKIFRKYRTCSDNDFDFKTEGYWMNVMNRINLKIGDWFLFKHIDGHNNTISRPILALFIDHTVWDQALTIGFVENKRAFGYWNTVGEYEQAINFIDSEVQYIQFWTDDIKVLGYWKNKPTLKELKEKLRNENNTSRK